jgi:hypothetical protein
MDFSEYGLVELPNEERYGFIWVVLTAGVNIDVQSHLGNLAAELAEFDYASFGYHDYREFECAAAFISANCPSTICLGALFTRLLTPTVGAVCAIATKDARGEANPR